MNFVTPTVEFFRSAESVGAVDFVEPNLNLLAHAQTIELEIGSRCGGHGKCGGDRVRILPQADGSAHPALSPVTDEERRHLTAGEIESGFRLACQCFPNDAKISIRLRIGE